MEQQQQPQQPQQPHEPVHCFWALMTYGDLRFIYLSSSVQRAVSAKYKQLLGQSFFDYIHPDEAKLARKDLNAFMDVHNLYGSVTRCRFRNVCPEWQLKKFSRQTGSVAAASASAAASAAALNAAAKEGGLSSRGLGRAGLDTTGINNGGGSSNSSTIHNNSDDNKNDIGNAPILSAEGQPIDQETPDEECCKDYEDIFQNGEEDDFMILDVVMNVVSDEVVLGFFHIDGQGLYKGFWSNGICGESKESLASLAPEIMRHLQDSVDAKNISTGSDHRLDSNLSSTSSPRRQTDNRTKRIFQIYDSQNRNLLLTWPDPGNKTGSSGAGNGTVSYNPDLYTQIVKSHHIPADALGNTTCLKRFCSKHALPNLNPSSQEPSYQVESVFIPYGYIIFACFQTSPATPVNTWSTISSTAISAPTTHGSHVASPSPGSRSFGSNYEAGSPNDHLSGLGLLSSPGGTGSNLFGVGGANSHGSPSSTLNSPLVIPSLPSLSPFLKHAVVGQMTMSSAQVPSPSPTGPIRNTGNSNHSSAYHPYSRSSALSSASSAGSSPSNLPLPESMQESLSFLNDYKPGDIDGRGGTLPSERRGTGDLLAHSMWHASTPHPAIAAMVGHALAPSSLSFQRTVTVDVRPSHGRQKSSSPPSSTLAAPVELHSSGNDKDTKSRKMPPSPRHPAHDAAIRKKPSSSASSSSPPATLQELDSNGSAGHVTHVLRVQEEKACESCGTTNSPEWRRGQSGKKDLCNACGLRYSRSVARQNRQAQKQLEGKVPKTKVAKAGKATKATPKKAGGATDIADHGAQTNRMQQQPQQPQPQQQQSQQQQPHFGQGYTSSSYANTGVVPTYSIPVSQPSFYHGP